MNRRKVLGAAVGASFLSGCVADPLFSFAWTEEVQLHDGRIILVRVKRRYRRLGLLILRKRHEPVRFLSTEISFDAGVPIGFFSHVFESHVVVTIEHVNEKWFLILEQRYGAIYEKTPAGLKEKWGEAEDWYGHKFLRIDAAGLVPAPPSEFGGEYLKPNMLMDNADTDVLAELDNGFLSLKRKQELVNGYPLNPLENSIKRRGLPPASS